MLPTRYRQWQHQGLSFLLGLGTALGLGFATPSSVNALPWLQLLLQGNQYLQLSNVSKQEEVQLGGEINQKLHSRYKFDSNRKLNAYVNRVGQSVARVSDCSQLPFHFSIVQEPQLNAFSTTGGYVYVNTGLLKAIDNQDQLAAVLGHEIGHICNNDLIHKMRSAALEQGLVSLASADRNTLLNLGVQLAVDLPNSRQDEFNADAKGLKYIERAGYDPHAMVAFLSKLLKEPSPPKFLSDHPGTQERIAVLKRKIASSQ